MPRNEPYRVPRNQVRAFKREGKKMVNGPFDCPRCGLKQLVVIIDKNAKEAAVSCPSCGLKQLLKYAPAFQGVDYYNKFFDGYRQGS
jgi:transcription elongation factor Elf1